MADGAIIDDGLTTYIDMLTWDIPQYLKEAERNAIKERVPIIRRSVQTLMAFILKQKKPSSILEIGAGTGFSSMLMSEYVPDETSIDTIEKARPRIEAARKNYAKYGKQRRINLIEGDALQVLADLAGRGEKYEFIFMDAAQGQYANFLKYAMELMPAGGMILADNVLHRGDVVKSRYAVAKRDRTIHGRMREFLYEIARSKELNSIILPIGDGVAISVKEDFDGGE